MAAGAGPVLPPDSTGKTTGAFSFGTTPVIYLPAGVMVDSSGNELASATSAPTGTERALVTRPIAPASQTVTGTVAATQSGTWTVTENTTTRTNVTLYAEAVAGAASEALITLSQSKAFATATTGTSYTVTSGKTLRIHALVITWVATTTTANTSRIRIRVNTAGAAAVTSPIAYSARIGWESPTFIANEAEFNQITFPGGIDVPSGSGVGVTHLEAAANGTIDVTLVGFEY